jgi:hypothetical protein
MEANELRVGILFLYIEAHKTKKCLSVKLDQFIIHQWYMKVMLPNTMVLL